MPLTPLTSTAARYFLRRPDGEISGPFPAAGLAALLRKGELDGSEDISTDRTTWVSVRELAAVPQPQAAATAHATASAGGPLDLDADADGILLAPLEIGLEDQSRPSQRNVGAAPDVPATLGPPEPEPDAEGIDLGSTLELEERNPPPAHAQPSGPAHMRTDGPPRSSASAIDPAAVRKPIHSSSSAASATVASLLESEGPIGESASHQPLRLDEVLTAPAEVKPVRSRTLTAARGGQSPGAGSAVGTAGGGGRLGSTRWRPSRRQALIGGGILLVAGAAVVLLVTDVPDRLRGEPRRDVVLGAVAAELAQDRFPSFSQSARLLEEAAGTRRHTPVTRAAAAELLASSVVIHGGDRGRIARAEALLDSATEPPEPARTARARARAWVALAQGRWKDAERIVSDTPTLPAADGAVLRGWAALGREDSSRAVQQFESAVQVVHVPPQPSRTAALYALARAQEADLSVKAEAAFRAVLAEAPAHVGAALGISRVSKLSPSGRLKLVEAVIAKQGSDASKVELGEAFVLVARAMREQGEIANAEAKAEAALKHARELDPASVAVAVLAGDILLAEGRTDEAVSHYKLALGPPVSAARTSSVRFARVAALIESPRRAEATAALNELDRRLPGDARVSFWRGRAAERAQPADSAAADKAYREALGRDPRFLPASLQLARLLLDQHHGADALAVLRRAEREGVAAAPLRMALGQALLASGNAPEAARTFRQLIATEAKSATASASTTATAAHLALAAALEAQGNVEGARAELATLGGSMPGVGVRMASVLIKLGRKQEALAAYQREIASGGDKTPATKTAAARLALDLRQFDVARTLAQAAVEADFRTPGALLVLAQVRRATGDLSGALSDLRRALAVDGSPAVQLEYGRALSAFGRDEDALSALAQAQDLPEAALERGRILLRRGDAETAVKDLANATTRLSGSVNASEAADAFLLLGDAEDRLGHAPRAESAWRAAMKLAPTSAETRYRLGRLEMDRGRVATALPHLRAAVDHLPVADGTSTWRADLFFQLGFAELRQGGRDRALAAFKRYLTTAPADAPARVEVTRQMTDLGAPPK